MNISYSWLKQYLTTEMGVEELSTVLTSIGLEVGGIEKIESIRGGLRGIVIGKVLTCEAHPDSDHLHITTVDLGGEKPEQIVCGAPNVAAGPTVAVATVGTTLYAPDGKEFQIKKSKIRGVESFGMICAQDEIGIGSSHDGIMVLPGDVKPGTSAAEYFKLTDDYCIEVDLTPNRIDAASHYGVARDVAAWMKCHQGKDALVKPSVDAFEIDEPQAKSIKVQVDDTEACPRYCGLTIEGVTVKDSPDWLRNSLTNIGLRPINNIVDVTNYILMGIGQPLHCFDTSKIEGGKIVVRKNTADTKFITLDGEERTVTPADLMICDAVKPMCIAGVFGGLDSGVTESATGVFIESACFNPTTIRRTARRHGLNTDASFRYERGVDPNGCLYALKLAALLIKEVAGGKIAGNIEDIYPVPEKPFDVELTLKYLSDLYGYEIPEETVKTILKGLEINIAKEEGDKLELEVPTYRIDVKRPCDVAEDILRIYGYNNIPMPDSLHTSLSYKTRTDSEEDMRLIIASQLTGAGYNEILNNSLTAVSYYADSTAWPAEKCVKLLNPLSQDLSVMRQTLLFGGLESIGHNINRKLPDIRFYEFGNVYFFKSLEGEDARGPLSAFSEGSRLAMWLSGERRNAAWQHQAEESSFFDLRADVANVFARLGLNLNPKEITIQPSEANNCFAQALEVSTRSGKSLGFMAIVAPEIAAKFEIKQPVYYAEFDWKALVAMALRKNVSYTPLARTHPVKRDLSLLLDARITMADVEKTVMESEKKLLRDVQLFDVYEGEHLPAGKKSYAIAITLQDDEKTLQDKQIDAVMKKITDNLAQRLGASLR